MKHGLYSDLKFSLNEKWIFPLGKIMNFLSWILNLIPSLEILQREMNDPLTIAISKLIWKQREVPKQQPETLKLAKESRSETSRMPN